MIRPATPADVGVVLAMVKELAAYEREPDAVSATERNLHDALFAPQPYLWCHLAEVDGEVAGFSLWFLNFSTWVGKHGIYLEDLYVRPAFRGTGIGVALLRQLAQTAVERSYGRVEWSVLDWNAPSIEFYRRAGAVGMDEWTVFRLSGDALNAFAAKSPG